MKFNCIRIDCNDCEKAMICDDSPYYGMRNVAEDDFINVSWRNIYGIGIEAINKPITMDGKYVGEIKDINEKYVYGCIFAKALPELNVGKYLCSSFEIKGEWNND